MKKQFALGLLGSLILQHNLALAQLPFEQQTNKSKFSNIDEITPKQESEHQQPYDDTQEKDLQECMSSIDHNYNTSSAFKDISRTTKNLIQSQGIDRGTVKKIYQKNGCNTDAVDIDAPDSPVNPLTGFKLDSIQNQNQESFFSKNSQKIKDPVEKDEHAFGTRRFTQEEQNEILASCKKQKLLEDVEGCNDLRTIDTAIQKKEFTSQHLEIIQNRSKNLQAASKVGTVITIVAGSLEIADYIERHFFQKENQKQEKTNQPSKTSAPQKSDTPNTNHSEHKTSVPVEKEQAKTQESKKEEKKPVVEPIPVVEPVRKNDPDLSTEAPEYAQLEFEKFTNEVKEGIKSCDQRKKARDLGVSLGAIKNSAFTDINSSMNQLPKKCNLKQLQRDLNQENALKDGIKKCALLKGITTLSATQKKDCDEVQNAYFKLHGLKVPSALPQLGISPEKPFNLHEQVRSLKPNPNSTITPGEGNGNF